MSAEASGPDESLQMIPIELDNNGCAARLSMAIGYVLRGVVTKPGCWRRKPCPNRHRMIPKNADKISHMAREQGSLTPEDLETLGRCGPCA